jgi:hypothetical protein
MKRIQSFFGIILLVVILLPSFYIVILQFEKKIVQREVRQKIILNLPEVEFQYIKISKHLFNTSDKSFRMTKSDEFCYNGKMYDIIEKQIVSDEIWFLVYPDLKETGIRAKLETIMNGLNRTDFPNENVVNQFVSTFHLFIDEIGVFKFEIFSEVRKTALIKVFNLSDLFSSDFFHPPVID